MPTHKPTDLHHTHSTHTQCSHQAKAITRGRYTPHTQHSRASSQTAPQHTHIVPGPTDHACTGSNAARHTDARTPHDDQPNDEQTTPHRYTLTPKVKPAPEMDLDAFLARLDNQQATN